MTFRTEIRSWLDENCPKSCRGPGETPGGGSKVPMTDDQRLWLSRAAEKGYTVPTWPEQYGGAGLTTTEEVILYQEMAALGARAPVLGMGIQMIGPTLLEHGTDDQKARHLPKIARGEVWWCQGYSEPGAGSDLASLRTRAEDAGDHFVINGQKIWTSGADNADWIFCLVRTDPDVPKHEGISFLLFTMDQPGVKVKPIELISGSSPFCETFFDNAIAHKDDLVGKLDRGWTVAKRLLQHERSGMRELATGGDRQTGPTLPELAREYRGQVNVRGEVDGAIADPQIRDAIARHQIDSKAFRLTQRRTVEESQGSTPGPATSIFKLYGANLIKDRSELQLSIMGSQGVGWDQNSFTADEFSLTRSWLGFKAHSIAGGSNEVQKNIIAKRVLGLPD